MTQYHITWGKNPNPRETASVLTVLADSEASAKEQAKHIIANTAGNGWFSIIDVAVGITQITSTGE